ncbi:hypothetical protein SBOR_0251 [Sclerotinia borealis F-4128]|uniref:Uncharacterized protein n=1 Tax=Sclerotinia borealis (strain F-4128) TaxID=1432307 RepID=W9CU36_SCLBF|nr:hypothetical protein SBOR_0251 [Sclerotinia borealis F-4128]
MSHPFLTPTVDGLATPSTLDLDSNHSGEDDYDDLPHLDSDSDSDSNSNSSSDSDSDYYSYSYSYSYSYKYAP